MNEHDHGEDDRLREEVKAILAEPTFVRSPVMSKLLQFLLQKSLAREAGSLKAYTVATTGLGKHDNDRSDVESYARVQVARLRKALDAFYGSAGAARHFRLKIRPGSYELELLPLQSPLIVEEAAEQKAASADAGHPERTRRINWLLYCGSAGLVLLIVSLLIFDPSSPENAHWQVDDFPLVEVTTQGDRNPLPGAKSLQQRLVSALSLYDSIAVTTDLSANAQYRLAVDTHPASVNAARAQTSFSLVLTSKATGHVLWTRRGDVLGAGVNSSFFGDAAFEIANKSGVVHGDGRERLRSPETPYGCWLRFATLTQSGSTLGDEALEECAENWHAAQPNDSIAAALYGWTLADISVRTISGAKRLALLEQSMEVLNRARALNPRSGVLLVSLARTYAFAGRRSEVLETAREAAELDPHNLNVKASAGYILALWNDPEGERMLREAVSRHTNAPPWYFIGIFIAEMMRDDVVGAGETLEELSDSADANPFLLLLIAAHNAREGHQKRAEESLSRLQHFPFITVPLETILGRLPVSPEVRNQLRKWLETGS